MRVFRDADADLSLVTAAKVAVLGYGNQGHAHALNLRDSGVAEVAIASGPASAARAAAAGFRVMSNEEAAEWADILMILAPDEAQAEIWERDLRGRMRPGSALAFGHGFNIHFGLILPPAELDVILVAPKGPGRGLRAEYLRGSGLACLIGVAQDASGRALDRAVAYAAAIGGGRLGILETTFREECETDLFGEQAVLCGGIPDLILAGYETLVEAGYPPELAYFECLHEVKLIADLLHDGGIAAMRGMISNTAEFGGQMAAPRIVTDETRAAMRSVLDDIRSGRFTRRFMGENLAGRPELSALRAKAAAHPIEEVGARLRAMMRGGSED